MTMNIEEQNKNSENQTKLGCNPKQNPKATLCLGATILATLIISFSIMALVLRDQGKPTSIGKKFKRNHIVCPVLI